MKLTHDLIERNQALLIILVVAVGGLGAVRGVTVTAVDPIC